MSLLPVESARSMCVLCPECWEREKKTASGNFLQSKGNMTMCIYTYYKTSGPREMVQELKSPHC